MLNYYSVSDYYKKTFGSKVYKISLDAGCTCPTRDGTKGKRGCIFCSQSGSGDFTARRFLSISEQIIEAKKLVEAKQAGRSGNNEKKYIAYFQNFTNTYGNPDILEAKYKEALNSPNIVGLSIATRPDCISEDILNRIAKIAKNTYVSIELGLQTSNEKTADFIRRGYKLEEYGKAVKLIHQTNKDIHVVTHIIFGLPNETETDMLNTVAKCVQEGTDGIKISVLHILRNTDLEPLWNEKKITCLSQNEYYSLLGKALAIIPKNIVIHRLTGDGAKNILLDPLWTANKRKVLNDLTHYFSQNNIQQGSAL